MLETVFHSSVMSFVPSSAELSLRDPAEKASDRASPARDAASSHVRLHLLVVESDPAVRSACSEIAASLGFAVQVTADLAQARSLLRGRRAVPSSWMK